MNEALKDLLLEWRKGFDDVNKLFQVNDLPHKQRFYKNEWGCINNTDIENIIIQMPQTLNELEKIPGLGPVKIKKYGSALIEIISDYVITEE